MNALERSPGNNHEESMLWLVRECAASEKGADGNREPTRLGTISGLLSEPAPRFNGPMRGPPKSGRRLSQFLFWTRMALHAGCSWYPFSHQHLLRIRIDLVSSIRPHDETVIYALSTSASSTHRVELTAPGLSNEHTQTPETRSRARWNDFA